MAANDYLILTSDQRPDLDRIDRQIHSRLIHRGWRRSVDYPLLRVYVAPHSRLVVTPAHDGHGVVVGDVISRSTNRSLGEDARRSLVSKPLDEALAARRVAEVWGRYILVRTGEGVAAVLRDPSGVLDCVAWRLGEINLFASTAAEPIDELLPLDTQIDEDQVRRICAQPGEYHDALGLTHLEPVCAGALVVLSTHGVQRRQVWRPAEIYRARTAPATDGELREVVVETVRALVGTRLWIAELSGGLDSAIVAACLTSAQRRAVRQWVNHVTPQVEGDERLYARAVAERLEISLTEVERQGLPLSSDVLAEADGGFRPSINDLDPGYNSDIASRIEQAGVEGVITGQGGDAVFYQMATPMVGIDEIFERGGRARPSVLYRNARWCRRSSWPQTWWRAWRDARSDQRGWTHPWTDDLGRVPPGKAFQINALAYSQIFQQASRRSNRGECLNPLLSQPIVELGLALSTVDLTWGGRDRALIRRAFAGDLPPLLLERRSKGDVGAFYGHGLRPHLPWLRDYLMGGALAERDLLDRRALDHLLNEERLIWQGDYGRILSLAWTEAWLRHWRSRLASRSTDLANGDQTSRWSAHTSA